MAALALHRRVSFEGLEDVTGLFVGRGAPVHGDRADTVSPFLPPGVEAAYLEQVHSATVLDARPGANGRGDALVTRRRGLALAVVTADCVPVLLADDERVGAVHAGWRGLVAGIVGKALERFDPATTRAWIGPAISGRVYEVGDDVASRLAAVGGPDVLRDGPRGRACADLQRVARRQIASAGVAEIRVLELCTLGEPELLHSYRRDGAAAGRNWSLVWRA
ncbi:MAG: peptidoglycan editing factor PgeF [Acidobacteriota bacterium]